MPTEPPSQTGSTGKEPPKTERIRLTHHILGTYYIEVPKPATLGGRVYRGLVWFFFAVAIVAGIVTGLFTHWR
jgi:hypothetical protein